MAYLTSYSYRAGILSIALALLLAQAAYATGGTVIDFSITSPAFTHGAFIPERFSCDGADISPELILTTLPMGTKSLVLFVDDPDAPGGLFTHWSVFDLDPKTKNLPQGGPLPDGAKEGLNGFARTGYNGPCPPRGHGLHRYFFTLYALDIDFLGLPPGVSRGEIEHEITGHIITSTQLTGLFERSSRR